MDNQNQDKNFIDEEAKRLIQEQEGQNASNEVIPTEKKSLGKVQLFEDDKTIVEEIGWIRVKPETLPSQGIFYPTGTEILIRAANAAEIRHWSTIDEEDLLSLDDALTHVVDKCTKIKFPDGSMGKAKDIKEIDRFFIVFAIREFTFKKGENQLNVTFKCKNCGKNDTRSISKEMLSYYNADPQLQARFDAETRCFVLKLKSTGEETKLYLPSLGVMAYIKGYLRRKSQQQEEYDKAFIKWAPFLFPDWRILSDALYEKTLQDSFGWTNDKISVVDWFVDTMQKTVKPELTHSCSACSTEVSAPINFRGGVKSLFLLSDISSKLL